MRVPVVRPFALVVLVACASAPNLPLRPDPQPPAGSTTEVITARDGTQLLARHWATADAPKAVVVIMHGLKDYSARYAELANELVAHGYAVYAFDLRGHGRSAGPRVAPDDWFDYVDDLDRFLTSVEQREPGKPVFLFGHSMGGLIAGLAAERHQPRLAGLVLSGPALAIDAPPLLIAGTRLFGGLAPGSPGLKLPNSDFSSDPKAAAAMDADPLVSQGAAPTKTAVGLIDGMRAFWAAVDALTMPLLALHGTADKLTAPTGSRLLVERAPTHDKTLHIYPGFFHDLVHEPRGAEVRGDLIGWLDAHVAGGTAIAPLPMFTGHLDGDPRGWTQSVAVAVGLSGANTSDAAFAGRLAVDLARPAPIGWSGSLSLRQLERFRSVALRPVGAALRLGSTAIGGSVGASIIDRENGVAPNLRDGYAATIALAAGAWLEQPLGPVHVSLFLDADKPRNHATSLEAGLALRLIGDASYWPDARAGLGPFIAVGISAADGVTTPFALLGVQLYGAD